MKQAIIILLGTLLSVNAFSNVNHIDISKISSDSNLVTAFNFIKDNQQYYDHWASEWSYDKSKDELKKELKADFSEFSALPTGNEELFLLLGDIAHYLHNLDDTAYYKVAIKNYNLAINANPTDYRPYWFLGFHYALSNVPVKAVENLLKAQTLLPAEQSADFWNEYSWAAYVTNMPSHCIYAMDKVRSITGKKGSFETQFGQAIYKKMIPVDKDKSYNKQDLWVSSKGEKIAFTSRPLGIKILIDSTWNLSINDYAHHQGAFIINPPALLTKKGQAVPYTIAILMKTAGDSDKLDDYLNKFVSQYPNKHKVAFSDKYDKTVAYEIRDKTMYQNHGGGHLYMIGVERDAPKYPGLLLEDATALPQSNAGMSYYRASDSKDRFKGKLFYAVMLDSCEDIHEESLAILKTLFDNQIIIE